MNCILHYSNLEVYTSMYGPALFETLIYIYTIELCYEVHLFETNFSQCSWIHLFKSRLLLYEQKIISRESNLLYELQLYVKIYMYKLYVQMEVYVNEILLKL